MREIRTSGFMRGAGSWIGHEFCLYSPGLPSLLQSPIPDALLGRRLGIEHALDINDDRRGALTAEPGELVEREFFELVVWNCENDSIDRWQLFE